MWSCIILAEPLLQVQKQHWSNSPKCSRWTWLYAPSLDDLMSPQRSLVGRKFSRWGNLDIYRQTQSEPFSVSPSDVYQGHFWFHIIGLLWGTSGRNSCTGCWFGSKGCSGCSTMGACHLLHLPQYFDLFSEKESRSLLKLGVKPCSGA